MQKIYGLQVRGRGEKAGVGRIVGNEMEKQTKNVMDKLTVGVG